MATALAVFVANEDSGKGTIVSITGEFIEFLY